MRQPMYPEVPSQMKPPIPPGLNILMNDLTKEVLRANPEDIYKFCAQHFERLMKIKDGELPTKQAKLRKKNLNTKHKYIHENPAGKNIKKGNAVKEKANNSETEHEKLTNQDVPSSVASELTKVFTNEETTPAFREPNLTDLKGAENEKMFSNSNVTMNITEDRDVENKDQVIKEVEVTETQFENESIKLIQNTVHAIGEINYEIVRGLEPVINTYDTSHLEPNLDSTSDSNTKTDNEDNLENFEPAKLEIIDKHNVEELTISIDSEEIQNNGKYVDIELNIPEDNSLIEPAKYSEDQIVDNTPQAENKAFAHDAGTDSINYSNQSDTIKDEPNDNFKLQKETSNENSEKTNETDIKEATINVEAVEKIACKTNETIETVIIAETSTPHRINEQIKTGENNEIQNQVSVKGINVIDKHEEQILEPNIEDGIIVIRSKEGHEYTQNTTLNDANLHNNANDDIETVILSTLKTEKITSKDNLVENIPNSEDKLVNIIQETGGENNVMKIDCEAAGHIINKEIAEVNNISDIGDLERNVHMTEDKIVKENVASIVDFEEALNRECETLHNTRESLLSNELSNQSIRSSSNENAENITASIHENSLLQSKPELASEVPKQNIDIIASNETYSEVFHDNENKHKNVHLNERTLDDRAIKMTLEQTEVENFENINRKSTNIDPLPHVNGKNQLAMETQEIYDNNDKTNEESQNIMVIMADDTYDQEFEEISETAQKSSDIHMANLNMDMETAATTIQKVFRKFLFRSKSSNPDESIDGQRSETEDLVDRENNIFETFSELNIPILEPIIDSNMLLTRMNSVLQTVNEEKSSLSTDDSSDTLSSAATKIQAHVSGFLVGNKYNSNKTYNSSDTMAPSMADDNKSLDDYSLNELPNEKQVIRITLTDPKLIESIRDDNSFDTVNNYVDMTLRAQSSDRASEARRRLKREDAIQSISPFSSSETPTIIQAPNKESSSDEQVKTSISDEEAEDSNKILNVTEGDKVKNIINDLETENTYDDTLQHYPKTHAFRNNEATKNITENKESSSEGQECSEENEFQIPKISEDTVASLSADTLQQEQDEILQITITESNNEIAEGISSDEMDVVTPKIVKSTPKYSHEKAKVHEMILKVADDDGNEKDSDTMPGLLTTGELHDVPLPTRVIRQNSSIVREFDAVILLYLIWKHN